jgi:hypothetical protein
MWRLKLLKFVKFRCSAMEGGFATSAATSSYVIIVSILTWDCTRRGAIHLSCVFAKNF